MTKRVNAIREAAVAAEIRRRNERLVTEATAPKFDFNSFTFLKQREFFKRVGGRFRSAVCSRRAGKSVGIAADMVDTCLSEAGVICLYITLTRNNAKNIIWFELKNILDKYKIEYKPDDHELVITFPNKSRIYVSGAKDKQEIEKYRGWKLRKCYIDECQSFRPYIRELVNDIITPALRDLRGELYLTGTPGPVPVGFFYEVTQSDLWDNFYWTAFDNPHMHDLSNNKDLEITLAEERAMKGISKDDPSYIRETYGRWVEDKDSLVFKFTDTINTFDKLPGEFKDYTFIFGIDIGYNDADSISVIGYNNTLKQVFLVDEDIHRKQDITMLVDRIKKMISIYNPVKIVMDAGALGKKIHEEIVQRHGINIVAAEKHRKIEFIELLNDDLRRGRFKAFKGSVFAEDCMLVQWDRESRIRNPEKPKISDTYHSDAVDSTLYAWRECLHYLSEEPEAARSTDKFMDELEQREAERMERRKNDPYAYLDEQFEDDCSILDKITDDWDL